MNRIAWFHFSFDIPGDWEPSAYAVETRVGRIEFSNRSGYQALVSWEPCSRKPDLRVAMVSFLRKKMPHHQADDLRTVEDISTLQEGDFVLGWHGDMPAQAVGYVPEDKVLLRWIFEDGSEGAVNNRWRKIAASFQSNCGATRRYALFGLRFSLPGEFALEDMNCLPANVMMAFESKTKLRVTFRRWGLTEIVLQGRSLADFYAYFLQHEGCREMKIRETRVNGCRAVEAGYCQRGQHKMDRFMGKWWSDGRAVLWHDEHEGRVYSFEQIGPRKAPRLNFADVFPHLTSAELKS